jgi:Uma2 family endonuclease
MRCPLLRTEFPMSILQGDDVSRPVDRPRVPEFPYSDGAPMDTGWHSLCMLQLIEAAHGLFRGRSDYYVGGNMFVYYSHRQERGREFLGPDFFVVRGGVNLHPVRFYWAVWDEGGRLPDVIVELLSPTTADNDRTTKREI